MNDKVLSMLGLSRRAGAIIIGTDLVTKSLPSGKVKLVIYASDASANTEKKITDKCKFYNTKCIKSAYDGSQIAHAIGKQSLVSVVGLTDENFSRELIRRITNETR